MCIKKRQYNLSLIKGIIGTFMLVFIDQAIRCLIKAFLPMDRKIEIIKNYFSILPHINDLHNYFLSLFNINFAIFMPIVSQYNIRFASGVYYEEPKFIYQYYMCIHSYYKIDEILYIRSILPTSGMRSGIRAASAKYDNVKAWMQMYDSLYNNGLLEKYYCEAQYLFIRYFMYLSLRVWSAFEIVADDILLLKTYMNQKFPDYKQNIYCVDDPVLNASYQLSDGRILTAFELLSCDVTPDFLAEYNLIWTKINSMLQSL